MIIFFWQGSVHHGTAIFYRHISGSLSPHWRAESAQVQDAGRAARSDRVVTAPTETK